MRKMGVAVAGIVLVCATAAAGQQRGVNATLAAADHYAIQQLYARFVHGLDSGADNGQMFAGVFTADGVFVDEEGRTTTGRQQLATLARTAGSGPTSMRHILTNAMIVPSASGASGRVYVMTASPGAKGTLTNNGQYWDDLVKTPEGWRISRRTYQRTPPPAPAAPAVPPTR